MLQQLQAQQSVTPTYPGELPSQLPNSAGIHSNLPNGASYSALTQGKLIRRPMCFYADIKVSADHEGEYDQLTMRIHKQNLCAYIVSLTPHGTTCADDGSSSMCHVFDVLFKTLTSNIHHLNG